MAANEVRMKLTAVDKTARAFARVKKGLTGIGKAALNVTKRIAQVGAVMATGMVAAGVAIVNQQMKVIDSLGKTASKIGTSTQALGELQHAASLTGVTTETMNMALQRYVRRTAEAARGTGEAVGALNELGLNAEELLQLDLDVQMQVLAEAMAQVTTDADRVRLAMKLFDSEGVSLVNTLALGGDGLKKMGDEARQLGIILTDIEVDQVEKANDQITEALAIFEGLKRQFTVFLAPIIGEVARRLKEAALDTKDFGNMGVQAARAVINGIGAVIEAVHSMRIFLKRAELAWDSFEVVARLALQTLLSPITAVINGINAIRESIGLPFIDNPIAGMLEEGVRELRTTQAELDALLATDPSTAPLLLLFNEIVEAAGRSTDAVNGVKDAVAGITGADDENTDNARRNVKTRTFLQNQELKGKEELNKWEQKTLTDRTASVVGSMNQLFAKNKAFQVAQAIMQTYSGATLALSSYPPPLNFAMAAAVVAAGLQQVAQIKAQSFEGGGFTGQGSRSGGLDGRGGFLGVLHPNESVIDHSRGGGSIVINNTVDATGADAMVDHKIRLAMQETSVQTIAAIQDLRRRGRGP